MNRDTQTAARHTLPGPDDITRVQLPNGIVLLSRSNFSSPSIFISGLLPAGALFDPNDKLGLADFCAAMLMRGTSNREFQDIYDTLESSGASMGFGCGIHSATFNAKALVEDLDTLLLLLAEVLRQPVFPFEQVERLRVQLLTALAIRSQDTGEMASLAFDQIVYKDHPYNRPVDGFPETIQAIQQHDLVAFHQTHYSPRGMLIAVVGGIDPTKAIDQVTRVFGDWYLPEQTDPHALPPITPLQEVTSKHICIPSKSQADLLIGAAGPARASPEFLKASLGNCVLGQFGMMGRIGEAVRENAGLAYYAASSLSGGPGPGPWDIAAGVDPQNLDQVIELILEQISRFVSEPISEDELLDSQTNFIGRLPMSMESNAGVAGALIHLERYQLGLDYYYRYPDLIYLITSDEVLETARQYLDPERLAIAVAGP